MSSSSSDSSSSRTSPYSSPSQQVPHLSSDFLERTCTGSSGHVLQVSTIPFLQIVEQPQEKFRFRYGSEMSGTHGCLLGKSKGPNKKKTHPAVQLLNYQGQAFIRCQLAEDERPDQHPHRLVDDDQEVDVGKQVPEKGSYTVAFQGIGIIQTLKKDVPERLYRRLIERKGNVNGDARDLRTQCEIKAKTINLNIVRLKFSAHDIQTGEEICEPVFSDRIYNMKSPATNDLKICRMSRFSGSANGGDDIIILVEKINKKNTRIVFFELDENGERIWESNGHFNQTDVHYQYAIAFRTPAYKDRQTPVDVTVYIELVRTLDGRTSEPKEFKYKADPVYQQMKKRKLNHTYPSAGGLMETNYKKQMPEQIKLNHSDEYITVESATSPSFYALSPELNPESPTVLGMIGSESSQSPMHNPMWGEAVTLSASEPSMAHLLPNPTANQPNDSVNGTENRFTDDILELLGHYCTNYGVDFPDNRTLGNLKFDGMKRMVPDSPHPTFSTKELNTDSEPLQQEEDVVESQMDKEGSIEYSAFYKQEDGEEVKQLMTDLCQMIKNNKYFKKQEIRSRLDRLFNLRLSNGDTLLHMTMFSSPETLEYIVKVIHSVRAAPLLDCANDRLQTALHLAVLHDMPKIVSLLVAKGANPMLKDVDDLNAIHYAVKYKSCLETLLDAIKENEVVCDLNEFDGEKQSALHMAVVAGWERGARVLLRHGASARVRDEHGRTPLHLAAYDDRLAVTKTLLEFIPLSEIDEVDDSGNTALKIVCGSTIGENTIEIARLLLEKKANPLKKDDHNESAWRLVKDKPQLKALLWEYVSEEHNDGEETNSTSDDDFESADEFDSGEDISMQSLAVALEDVGRACAVPTV